MFKQTAYIGSIIGKISFFFSMKSLTAAGKFKKRKYKEENQKKAVSFDLQNNIP